MSPAELFKLLELKRYDLPRPSFGKSSSELRRDFFGKLGIVSDALASEPELEVSKEQIIGALLEMVKSFVGNLKDYNDSRRLLNFKRPGAPERETKRVLLFTWVCADLALARRQFFVKTSFSPANPAEGYSQVFSVNLPREHLQPGNMR